MARDAVSRARRGRAASPEWLQLFVNVFTVAFTQELRWYGPGPLDADPGLRNGVVAATTAGSVLLVVGAIRRYVAESARPAPPA